MQDVATALVELRILDGPNLYFPRPAVKLTLDLSTMVDLPVQDALRLAVRLGVRDPRPGPAGTGFRQRFAARAVARLVRQVATEAGTSRLPVRARPDRDVHRLVVAYPWRHRSRAETLGHAVAEVLDALPAEDLDTLVKRAAGRVREADLGSGPRMLHPRIPVVAVTGSKGTTTVCRLVAHLAQSAGRHVGRAGPDGVFVDGVLVDAADHSGGAGRLLLRPEVDIAVTEAAHSTILLGGIGVTHNDVSVVTNVADAVGDVPEVETSDRLAEVKAVVARITRSDGWCVLNGDDPRVWAMRSLSPARPWVFSCDSDSPAVREALDDGARATTVVDDWVCVLEAGQDPDPLVRVAAVPIAGTDPQTYAVQNVLAAASAGLAVGLPASVVVAGLETFPA